MLQSYMLWIFWFCFYHVTFYFCLRFLYIFYVSVLHFFFNEIFVHFCSMCV
ncbi:hypothetical protein Hdeb2414_s0026g00677291 [Helianthus debilis subsp. tardiflorus]